MERTTAAWMAANQKVRNPRENHGSVVREPASEGALPRCKIGARAMNPAIPRATVHAWSEDCANAGLAFQSIARRSLEDQARLARFFKANVPQMKGQAGEVSLYLLAVVVRLFERGGGTVKRIGPAEIEAATAKIRAHAKALLPGDDGFPDRVRAVENRAQPHILDEALHALFEREERKDNEVLIPPEQAALVFLMLWAATEALDLAWTAPQHPEWVEPELGGVAHGPA